MNIDMVRTAASLIFVFGLVLLIANVWTAWLPAVLPLFIFGFGWFLILIDYLFCRKRNF